MQGPSQGRVLVTGAGGMLGSEVMLSAPQGLIPVGTGRRPAPEGFPVLEHAGVELTDAGAVEALFGADEFVGVIHCAAHTAVDKAESEEQLAYAVNAVAAENVARCAARARIPMVLVSIDFVFGGEASKPYLPTDRTEPLGAYGRTKFAGEELARAAHPGGVAVLRTQWLYGPRGQHFPGTMLRLAAERDSLRVVADQVGSPTSTLELAPALWGALQAGVAGIYHAACSGEASWCDFARETLSLAGSKTRVEPCSTEEFPRPAPRPHYSVLDCSSLTELLGKPLKPWREALADYLALES